MERKALKNILVILAFGMTLWTAPIAAQTYIGGYQTWISANDLVNSRGIRLTTIGQIIRQDRANFHRFGIPDAADGSDPWFHDAGACEILEVMVNNARISRSQRLSIERGGVTVRVDVYSHDHRLSHVDVTLVQYR